MCLFFCNFWDYIKTEWQPQEVPKSGDIHLASRASDKQILCCATVNPINRLDNQKLLQLPTSKPTNIDPKP